MPTGDLNFEGLARALLAQADRLVPEWLPGGKMRGSEYVCGDLRGGPGDSLNVNLRTGLWADFATDARGGDLINLYAAIHNIKQGEAAKDLARHIGFDLRDESRPLVQIKSAPKVALKVPPPGTPAPSMVHPQFGSPSASWVYTDASGSALFHVARYQTAEGKQMRPWRWNGETWIAEGVPAPRPLYGLKDLAESPGKPVLVVEGEKSADAARRIAGHVYAVVTWPNGAMAANKADWSPVYGRRVLIWPDGDKPGRKAALDVAALLQDHCPEIKSLMVPDDLSGWDAADALAERKDWAWFKAWAQPLVVVHTRAVAAAAVGTNGAMAAAQASVTINLPAHPDEGEADMGEIAQAVALRLATNPSNHRPICNTDNVLRILENDKQFTDLLWFDEFYNRLFTRRGEKGLREWLDTDNVELMVHLQRNLGMHRIGREHIEQAATVYAHRRARNEPRDWMETLRWDGRPRIEMCFVDCLGAEDSAYVRAASRNFWIGMAARIYRPGCQLDNMVILEGAQNIGKTSALRVIGGPWHAEAHESVTNKDFFMLLQGKLVVEIAELDSFTRAEVTRIKQVVSCPIDRYRVPFGHGPQDYPRRCVFVGTTNENAYLRDTTGARRFWPIKCLAIDLDCLRAQREQMFAEAVALFKQGATWYEMPADETAAQQEIRRHSDTWEDIVSEYLMGKEEIRLREIFIECLQFDPSRISRADEMRLANVMRTLNWDKRTVWRGGRTFKVWQAKMREPGEDG